MKTIDLHYDPYKMRTSMAVEGIDVCQDPSYSKFKLFIEQGTPLQTWIEPIPHLDWDGFVNELADPERNDAFQLLFSGRKIDLEDLQRAITLQNAKRAATARVQFAYEHIKVLDDKELAKNIEQVVKSLKSEQFKKLIQERRSATLQESYAQLDKNYALTKNSEFYIVLSGVYTCGKSTIINVLIRHDVLPTAAGTCTKATCRVRHDRSLGSKLSLTGYNSDGEKRKAILPTQVFESDADCAELFAQINADEEGKYAEVKMVEIGVNLSHLYPESVSDEQFTMVLIDTPGVDSSASSVDGQNGHAQIALDAISMDSKPMIILCAHAKKFEDKSIGEFMREILIHNKESNGGFNDRFLFLMNQCDSIQFNNQETIDAAKEAFVDYLTNCKKWNITEDESEVQELAKIAARFVPRVFLTSALAAWGIRDGVHECSRLVLRADPFRRSARNVVENFIGEVAEYDNQNFFLSRHCDLPQHHKDAIESQFQAALEADDLDVAAELQTGIISLELAIKDYIARYAYPLKVRALLKTFEDILKDVQSYTEATLKEMTAAEEKLGNKEGEKGGAEGDRDELEKSIRALQDAKENANKQMRNLEGIKFDTVALERAKTKLRSAIEADGKIAALRRSPIVHTGARDRTAVLKEIEELVAHINGVFDKALQSTNGVLQDIKANHDKQIEQIFKTLKEIVQAVQSSGLLKEGAFEFKNSAAWTMHFEAIDSEQFVEKMKKKVVDKTVQSKQVLNAKREQMLQSMNPFKWIGAAFAKKYVTTTSVTAGHYDASEITKDINTYLKSLEVQSQKMEGMFEADLNGSKKLTRDLIGTLLDELNHFQQDIEGVRKRIRILSRDVNALKAEIAACKMRLAWLECLEEKIMEV